LRYVQDVRYSAVAGMPRSVYVQDVRYNAVAGMPRSVYVQDVRYNAVPRMAKSVYVQDVRPFFAPCKNDISAIHGGRIARTQGCVGAHMYRILHSLVQPVSSNFTKYQYLMKSLWVNRDRAT